LLWPKALVVAEVRVVSAEVDHCPLLWKPARLTRTHYSMPVTGRLWTMSYTGAISMCVVPVSRYDCQAPHYRLDVLSRSARPPPATVSYQDATCRHSD